MQDVKNDLAILYINNEKRTLFYDVHKTSVWTFN